MVMVLVLVVVMGAALALTAPASKSAPLVRVATDGATSQTPTTLDAPKPVAVVNFPNPQSVQGVVRVVNLPASQNVVATNLPFDEGGRLLVTQRHATRLIELTGLHVSQGTSYYSDPLDVEGFDAVSVQGSLDGPGNPNCSAAIILESRLSPSYSFVGTEVATHTDGGLSAVPVHAPSLRVRMYVEYPDVCPQESVYRVVLYLH